jgi:hypothetical protein
MSALSFKLLQICMNITRIIYILDTIISDNTEAVAKHKIRCAFAIHSNFVIGESHYGGASLSGRCEGNFGQSNLVKLRLFVIHTFFLH